MSDIVYKIAADGQRVPLSDAELAQLQLDMQAVPAQPTKYFISKVEMWRRCTDAEAEDLYADLRNAPVRLQGLFDGATVIDTRDAFYPVLYGIVQTRVGTPRANEILAPTS